MKRNLKYVSSHHNFIFLGLVTVMLHFVAADGLNQEFDNQIACHQVLNQDIHQHNTFFKDDFLFLGQNRKRRHIGPVADFSQHSLLSKFDLINLGENRHRRQTSRENRQRLQTSGEDRQRLQTSGEDRQRLQSSGEDRQRLLSSGEDRQRLQSSGENRQRFQSSGENRLAREADYSDVSYETDEGCVDPGMWLAKVVYVGLAMKIPCDPCQTVFGVSWTKQVPNKAETSITFDSPNAKNKRVILGGDSAIYILHATIGDQGVYRCKGEEGVISTYRLEVNNLLKAMHVIRDPLVGGDGDVEIYGDKYNEYAQLMMYTDWSEWGECSECSDGLTHGERARVGYCYAMSGIDQYPLGLPCFSNEIPHNERSQFKGRLDEKEIEACHGYCPRENAIAKNLTIFERLLGRSDIEEPTTGYEGSYILFECPGLQIDSAVTWHNGTTLIDARYLAATGGRVSIDIYDGLQIFHLVFKDSMPYHCYVDGKRRQTFRLIVLSELIDTNEMLESFVYIGILILIYTMVFLIIMLAKHNIRRRQRVKKIEI